MPPIVIINFKTYKQGKQAVKLAKAIQKVAKNAIVAVQDNDIYEVNKATKLRIFSQHVDPFKPGRHTGYTIPEAVKKDRAKGTFLNHSEHKLKLGVLKKTMKRCKEVGLKTAVFADSLKEAKRIRRLRPDYLIIEPPELVAGKISVSKAKPELIKNIAKKLKYPFLVGAGIHDKQDVKIAMKLGAKGIAVSSAITKARNPGKRLREMLK
jgi:triosephosphate isomerase